LTTTNNNAAPLNGLRIIEFAGIGPGPFAGMLLADMGAEIIRIDKPVQPSSSESNSYAHDYLARGRKSLVLDLKSQNAAQTALCLIKQADGLIEGFRPGVMERLGLGPDKCLASNTKLVYGRMTGWGQSGPLANTAGHDLNYIALTGALWATGAKDVPPQFAMNLLGDFGAGGMLLAYGMVTGLLKAHRTGQGDVIDASIFDGTASLMSFIHAHRAMGLWRDEREANLLDGGAPWYAVYECADGAWISIAPLEDKFWKCLLSMLELDESEIGDRNDRQSWPTMRAHFKRIFASQPRAHWETLLSQTDACFAPVLSPAEASAHSHAKARGTYTQAGSQPTPAPKFANAKTPMPSAPRAPGRDSREILRAAGITDLEIDKLIAEGAVVQNTTVPALEKSP